MRTEWSEWIFVVLKDVFISSFYFLVLLFFFPFLSSLHLCAPLLGCWFSFSPLHPNDSTSSKFSAHREHFFTGVYASRVGLSVSLILTHSENNKKLKWTNFTFKDLKLKESSVTEMLTVSKLCGRKLEIPSVKERIS